MSPDEILAELRAPHAGSDALHLNAAGVAPMTKRAADAGARALAHMTQGSFSVNPLLAEYERARESFARLCGVGREDLAFFQTCAVAISQVAFGLDLRADDEIVLVDQEYPSNAYPWYRAAERAGAKVVVVKSREGLRVDTADVKAALTSRTRVVAVSWVQFSSGAAADLPCLAEAAHKVGAWLVTDAIQGLGVIPFHLANMGVDVACGGTHKWLLGPMGHGFFACAPGRILELKPLAHGAITYGTPDDAVDPKREPRKDPRRFEPGNPLLLGAIAGAASVEALLGIGIERVYSEALALKLRVDTELDRRGYRTLHSGGGGVRSPITTFVAKSDPKALVDKMRERKVSLAPRGGGVRVAPHVYCTQDHIQRFFSLLDELDRT
jgi:cysteine desulfurase / selenocysteine lyase